MSEKKPANQPRIISAAEYAQGWDRERSTHELEELLVKVRGTTIAFLAAMKKDMDQVIGAPVKLAKVRTFPEEFKVWVTPAKKADEETRAVHPTSDTEGSATMAFAIPLRKLNIRIPRSRTYVFPVTRIPVEGGGAVYEISFANFENMKRQLDEELKKANEQAKKEQAEAKRELKRAEAAARREQKKAEAAAKLEQARVAKAQ